MDKELNSLAIIIINWNSFDVTSNCLTSIRSVSYENFKIIVVDNGSSDDSAVKLKRFFPEIILLKNEKNIGFTGGNNQGIEYALANDFDLVMLLNNDTVVTSNFATILVETLISNVNNGAIQPKIMFNQERNIIWNSGSSFSKVWHLTKSIGSNEIDKGQYDVLKEIPWVTGCCFLTRSSIIRKVGMLDARFFIYYEDTDWSFRIKKEGYKLLYEPGAKIFHEVGKSNDNRDSFGEGNLSPFSHYINVRNHIFILRKYAKGVFYITSLFYQFYKFSGYTLYFLFRGRFKKLRSSIVGFYHGFTFDLGADEFDHDGYIS
jgi:GT2 family glycosyltransferase